MKRSVCDLANFPDERLFEVVSEGIPLIAENAVRLDDTAHRLYRAKNFSASEIIAGIAEEEAAKVLILIDLVRCPLDWPDRAKIARRFYGHAAKRIYALTCSYANIASFKELCGLVESECRPYYLDGPNYVDWIFPNSIMADREQALYVDYVRNLTDDTDDYYWRVPYVPRGDPLSYETPDSIKLSRALSDAGAKSPNGLSIIADVWRGFKPEPDSDREELRQLIAHTLGRLETCGSGVSYESTSNIIVSDWSFPLWSLTIEEPRAKPQELEALREERVQTIKWIEKTEERRHPPPAISGSKVKLLGDAHASWSREADARIAASANDVEGGFHWRSSADIAKDFELPSHVRLRKLFQELTDEERAALLALGWFARERVADWPKIYERARRYASTADDDYQLGYGSYWLAGLERWNDEPRPFEAGRVRRR